VEPSVGRKASVNLHAAGIVTRTGAAGAKALPGEGTMAVYDFKCKKCGTEFEITCHMDERDAQAVCPKCGNHQVEQKFSAGFLSPPPAKY